MDLVITIDVWADEFRWLQDNSKYDRYENNE